MNQEALTILTKARANMIIDQPFFGTLALRLRLQEDPQRKTFAVNGRTIFYNPAYVLELGLDLTKSAVAHEVMHCVFDHMARCAHRDHTKYNRAADFAINPMLKDAGFRLGKGWLDNPAFYGMSADHIYELLDDKDDGSGEALCEIESGSTDEDGNAVDAMSETIDWQVATAQAAQIAKMQGKLPESLKRFIDDVLGNRVDWRAQLRRFITDVSKNDYQWARPNRRFIASGLYLPSLHTEELRELIVVVDTSGSIDGPTLAAFAAEIDAARDAVSPGITRVIYCDAKVHQVDVFERDDPFTIEAIGGGGTDFRPPFEYIAEQGHEPSCLVYLTDMYGPFPTDAAPYPVLWCATSERVGPWGETVHVEI